MLGWRWTDGDRYLECCLTESWEKRFWVRWWGSIILSSQGHQANFCKPHPHVCMFAHVHAHARVCVCMCVSVCACVHARVREKEGALAPESALWGDHSCTLPAANWSLSSCPIHLHFLPITEHYLCSQLGMGLNPFWLSWCYSLQISNGEGGVGGRKEGKVEGMGRGGGKSHSKNKLKLPIILHWQEAINKQWHHTKERGKNGRDQLLAL